MKTVRPSDIPARIELLESLAFMAVEHGGSLDLLAFVAYVDLYAHHLELATAEGSSSASDFEAFVLDAKALEAAARAAERATGVPTRAPGPLGDAPAVSDRSSGRAGAARA